MPDEPLLQIRLILANGAIFGRFPGRPFFKEAEELRNSCKTPAEMGIKRVILPRFPGFTPKAKYR
jgi:hypothetical protein